MTMTSDRQEEPEVRSGRLRRAGQSLWRGLLCLAWLAAILAWIDRQHGSLTEWPLVLQAIIAIFPHFALQLCLVGACLAILALFRRSWPGMAAAGLLALWQGWIIWPHAPAGASAMAAEPTTLKVVSFNTWYRNDRYEGLVEFLRDSGADVVGLVEVTPGLKAALAPLRDIYPYQADCIDKVKKCEEMLLSRRPLQAVTAQRLGGRRPIIVTARLDLPGGPVTIALTHLSSSLTGLIELDENGGEIAQEGQALRLGNYFATLPDDAILMGDFNAAPWSRVLSDLRAAGGWRANDDLIPSWPRGLPAPLRLPIDHVFGRGRVTVTRLQAGPALTSDHLPVVADIAIRPEKTAP